MEWVIQSLWNGAEGFETDAEDNRKLLKGFEEGRMTWQEQQDLRWSVERSGEQLDYQGKGLEALKKYA